MSLTVTCLTCRSPENPRLIIQWPQNCQECADAFVSRHLAEFPGHRIELTGRISRTPYGDDVPKSVRRLFEPRRTA